MWSPRRPRQMTRGAGRWSSFARCGAWCSRKSPIGLHGIAWVFRGRATTLTKRAFVSWLSASSSFRPPLGNVNWKNGSDVGRGERWRESRYTPFRFPPSRDRWELGEGWSWLGCGSDNGLVEFSLRCLAFVEEMGFDASRIASDHPLLHILASTYTFRAIQWRYALDDPHHLRALCGEKDSSFRTSGYRSRRFPEIGDPRLFRGTTTCEKSRKSPASGASGPLHAIVARIFRTSVRRPKFVRLETPTTANVSRAEFPTLADR